MNFNEWRNQKQIYCVGGRHYSQSVNQIVYDESTQKHKNMWKITKALVVFVDEEKSHFI